MIRLFFRLIYKLNGWKVNPNLPPEMKHCVMTASPHTSNWDFIYMAACFDVLGVDIRFTVKKELNKPILGWILRSFGAIWIDRSPKKEGEARVSMVQAMSDLFKDNDNLTLVVTPEGTRGKRTEWKSGFFHVAENAGVPICLGYLDYDKKEGGVGAVVQTTNGLEQAMQEITDFYKDIAPKHADKFSPDLRYIKD